MGRTKWPATYTQYFELGMQLSPALQSHFSFHLGCGYARNKKKKEVSPYPGPNPNPNLFPYPFGQEATLDDQPTVQSNIFQGHDLP